MAAERTLGSSRFGRHRAHSPGVGVLAAIEGGALIVWNLVATPLMSAADLGTAIVDRYYESYGNKNTQSAIDLTQMAAVATAIDALAQALRDDWDTDPGSCTTAATSLQAALDTAVIHERHGSSYPGSHGLAIYFPTVGAAGDYSDTVIQFPGDTWWDEFLGDFASGMGGSWVATARSEAQIYYEFDHTDLYDFCDGLLANVPDDLGVTPGTDFHAAGAQGGPFSPSSKTYTLTNNGEASIAWTAAVTAPWVEVAPTGGTLDPAEWVEVEVSLTAAADALPEDLHTDTLTLTNTTSEVPQQRAIALGISDPPPAPTNAFHWFPMDTDPGWSTEGQWEFGLPQGAGDPPSGHTGFNVYGYNLSGNYADSIPAHRLTTTALDCSGYENVALSFWRWLGVESASYDEAKVEVSNNGSLWTTVWEHTAGTFVDTAWQECTYDISAMADNQPTVYVRWGMGPTDSSVTYPGWNIDDVALIGEMGDDLAVLPSTDFTPVGPEGGPFTPSGKTYTLRNNGPAPLDWTASVTSPWLDLSAEGGTLNPGTSTPVVVSLNASADSLPGGLHTDTVTFTNLSKGKGATRLRAVVLTVAAGAIHWHALDEDPGWSTTGEWAFGAPTGQGGYWFGYLRAWFRDSGDTGSQPE